MNYYMVAQNEQVLSHHGIVNMKWGVRNGPPYPLARRSDGSLNRQKQDNRKRFALGNMSQNVLDQLKKQADYDGDEHTLKLVKSMESAAAGRDAKAQKAKENFEAKSKEKLGDTIKSELQAAKAARIERREQRQREKEAARETEKRLAEEKAAAAAADEKEALKQYIRHNPTSIYKYADAFTDEEMGDLIKRIDLDRQIKDVRDQEIYRYKKYLETGASAVKTIANTSSDVINLYNNCASVWNAVGDYKNQKANATKDVNIKEKIPEGESAADYAKKQSSFNPLPIINKGNGGNDKKDKQTFKQKDGKGQDQKQDQDQDSKPKKSPRDLGSFVDDDAAEQKAREKKAKKKEKQSQNGQESAKSKSTADDKRSAIRNSSREDVESFWYAFNDVKADKIKSGNWTSNDEKNWKIVVDEMYKQYPGLDLSDGVFTTPYNLKHSGMEEDPKYGLPELKKYPMPDRDHVLSAIRFFNYVDPKNEEELAKAILARIREYDMDPSEINVGENNRFSKYVSEEYLAHYGILGQKWGLRRFQNEDGTLTPAGRERYHGMIATNVMKDRERQQRAVSDPNAKPSISSRYYNRNRNKVEKAIQKEFEQTPEGQRLKKANKDVAKANNSILRSTAKATAEQNEAQKAAAKTYEDIREKYKEELLDAAIKDLKIWEIDDGREFLEKYLRGDEDATFAKRDRKQERVEAKEVKEAKKVRRLEDQQKTFKELYGEGYDQVSADEEKRVERNFGGLDLAARQHLERLEKQFDRIAKSMDLNTEISQAYKRGDYQKVVDLQEHWDALNGTKRAAELRKQFNL